MRAPDKKKKKRFNGLIQLDPINIKFIITEREGAEKKKK